MSKSERDILNIQDCLFAIGKIEEYMVEILDLEDFEKKSMTYDAVLMNFIVIAEACDRLSDELKANNTEINWRGVKGFRNFIAHDYFGLDLKEIWRTIRTDLPNMKSSLEKILSRTI